MNEWAFPAVAVVVIAAGLAAGWLLDRIIDRVYGRKSPPKPATARGATPRPDRGGRSAGPHSR